jgi:hypothetical protein
MMRGGSVKRTILLAAFACASASAAPPAPGKSVRYCNPLPIEASSCDGRRRA